MKYLRLLCVVLVTFLMGSFVWADVQPGADDVIRLVTEKLQAKYRTDVDRTCDRLWEKIKGFSVEDRGVILGAMRRSVDRKISQVRNLEGLDAGRQQAILDLLQYVGRKLDSLMERTK